MTSRPKRAAVIGAGISGVVAAAHLKKEGIDVTVFERSSAAGGIWLYDERQPLEPTYPSVIASISERKLAEDGTIPAHSKEELQKLLHAPPGPCYVGLKNNVGTRLLATTLNPFPEDTPDFVSHAVLSDYIQDTAIKTGVQEITHYNTEVKHLGKSSGEWILEAATLNTDASGTIVREPLVSRFDTIVVASGHYHAPRVPDIPGLAELKRRFPSRIQHSKGYRKPDSFKDKNVLLIGASVSSTDIARELGDLAKSIYQSHRNGAFDLPASLLPENGVRVEEVTALELPPGTNDTALSEQDAIPATVTLKSGQKLCDLHHIILCTGYHITLPFLPDLHSDITPAEQADNNTLVTDGTQLHNLHKDIFYIPDPSLLFIGVPYFTATFTLFEFQAMVAAKVASGKVKLPSEKEMRREYEERVQAKGYGKAFHSLREKEVEYVDELLAWVNPELGDERLEGHTAVWKEAKDEQIARIRALFAGDGDAVGKQLEITCS